MATNNLQLDLAEIIEEAFERATGGARQMTTGHDFKTARRSLNLLTMEWANRGVNLWTLEQGTIPLIKNVGGYQMPANTIDLIEYAVRIGGNVSNPMDYPLSRMSFSEYAAIPNKKQTGRPQRILMQRLNPYPVLTLWPVPDNDNYTMIGWRLRRISDTLVPGTEAMDIPFRFMPALISGLAFHMAMKLPEGRDRAVPLKSEYETAFDLASLEDRDKSTTRFVPRIAKV